MAIFVDTFTGTSGTQLQSHTPDTGTSWTRLWGSSGTIDWVLDASNRATPETSANNGSIYTADATYPNANYYLEWTLVVQSTTLARATYGLIRVQDQENMYAVRLRGSAGNNCQLYKKVSGTWTALGSAFAVPADGSVCKLEINGTALKFYDDGVEIASATDSDISAAGKAGLAAGGGAELVDSTDDSSAVNIWDSLTVDSISTGLTISVSESITVSETTKIELISFVSVSETIAITETANIDRTNEIGVSEAITVTETANLDRTNDIGVSEAITVTETVQVENPILNITQSEAITLAEAVTVSIPAGIPDNNISVSEAITLSEAVAVRTGDLPINAAEAITVSESTTVTVSNPQINQSEAITITETVALDLPITISALEAITVAESVTAIGSGLFITASETIIVAEAVTVSGLLVFTGQIPTTVRPGGAVATNARGKLSTKTRPGGIDTTAREV